MADGVRKLRKIQGGAESPAGTVHAATWIWRGTGTIEDKITIVQPDENVGYLVDVERPYIPTTEAALTMDPIEATYEQLPYIQLAGIDGTVTGVRDGGSANGYIRTSILATDTVKVPQTYTLEGGDNAGAERFAYGFITDFELSGVQKEAWKMTANWIGRQVAPQAFTGGLTLQTVEPILFGLSTLYLDDLSGVAAATTAVSSSLIGASIKVNTGLIASYAANGQIYFDKADQVAPSATIDITFIHNTSSIAEKAKMRGATGRMMRIQSLGSALGGTPTIYPNKAMIIDAAGHWEKFTKIDESNGQDVVTGTFHAAFSTIPTPDLFFQIITVNALSVLV
jgi:hypothetical protein